MAFNNAQIANQWGQQYANARHLASVEQAQMMQLLEIFVEKDLVIYLQEYSR